ncbi:hypothetical protein N0V90_012899 [Kalmusia sp. IMI 367209]|nr:hypothetical protein N0V90_012899 [Kalmusia sp. IMI 367209]
MDPLSITASVITVASLAATTCATFKSLRDAYDVLPGRLHALNNEVVDFEAVCRQVIATLDQRASAKLSAQSDDSIRHLTQQAEQTLLQLQSVLNTLVATARRSRLRAANAWRKQQARLEQLQGNIKTVKCSLNILLGASHSHDNTHIRLELQAISAITSRSAHDQTEIRAEFHDSLSSHHDSLFESVSEIYQQVDERIGRMEDMLKEQADRLHAQQDMQLSRACGSPPPYRRRSSGQRSLASLEAVKQARADAVGIRVARTSSACRPGCPCACHSQKKSDTPAALERVVGRLFVGYAGLPFVSQKCTFSNCAKAQPARLSFEYWFPMSFVAQILRFQFAVENAGPQFALNFIRRVPDTAQCVGFAQAGNIPGLQDLFKRGLASPRDVSSTRGYSLLRWALYAKQWDTCKFLVHSGADADYRPVAAHDNSPRNKACDFVLQGFLSKHAEESLLCLTSGSDWNEEQNFSALHKVVTGQSFADLEETIRKHLDEIDSLDAMGRTPLIWAAARGDGRAVGLLLAHDADPNILDVQYTGAVSYAAERSHLLCVRLLLEAGALPDPPLPNGIFVGSALNCAARNSSEPLILKTLLDFGADTEASGVDKITPLIHTARTDNVDFAMLLLEYGANINATTATGQTPLTTAITLNSHNVLRLLLDRWYEYSTCPRLHGPHLLRTAALFADLETIKILTATDHFKLKYDKLYVLADCVEQFTDRFDVTEESISAFRDLLSVLNEDPAAMKGVDKLMESGLLAHKLHDSFHFDSDADSTHDSDGLFEDASERLELSHCSEKSFIDL